MAGNGGSIPKFGEWKTSDGAQQPYTMYFEHASKKRRSNSNTMPGGATPKPGGGDHQMMTTPPRTSTAADAKPVVMRSTDRANRSRNQQGKAGHVGSSVPTWGHWNENGNGEQQYTLVFEQLREERTAPPTPSVERPQRANTPARQDLYDNGPKGFTCCGLFAK